MASTSTSRAPPSPSSRACSTSWSSTAATRLCTVWKDWRVEPLVGRPQPPPERDHELDGDLGVARAADVRIAEPGIAMVRELVERLDGGRAALVVEHRELAEDVARAEARERDHATVGVLADRAGVAGAHDVTRVRVVALAEDDLLAVERARRPRPRPPGARSSSPSSANTGTRREELGGVLGVRRHAPPGYTASSARSRRRWAACRIASHSEQRDQSDRQEERAGDEQHAGADLEDPRGVVERVARASSRPSSSSSRAPARRSASSWTAIVE